MTVLYSIVNIVASQEVGRNEMIKVTDRRTKYLGIIW